MIGNRSAVVVAILLATVALLVQGSAGDCKDTALVAAQESHDSKGQVTKKLETPDDVVTSLVNFDASTEVAVKGTIIVGPRAKLLQPYAGIPADAVVRPMSVGIDYVSPQTYERLGAVCVLPVRTPNSRDPIGVGMSLHLDVGRSTAHEVFAELTIVPTGTRTWGNVLTENDVSTTVNIRPEEAQK
jgi:hypothetical protein